ncbi:MAG: FMN-binding negative transcriptional regulator [Mucilaginibacter polytrichastri]|nr:FMN-binding negative transcriptional regulator [Mucilaginibacter polytrichastri]
MYIPAHFRNEDEAPALAFMQRYPFATLVTADGNYPEATHLPFVAVRREGRIVLRSHFARANTQWSSLPGKPVLVIFTEPHAYISPGHYEKEQNVPTWNYIAIHAYGQARIIDEPEAVFALLDETVVTFEEAYKSQWDRLPDEYRRKMAKGVVAFEIEVTDLQAKYKLSQNRTEGERERVMNGLENSADGSARAIAEYMRSDT